MKQANDEYAQAEAVFIAPIKALEAK